MEGSQQRVGHGQGSWGSGPLGSLPELYAMLSDLSPEGVRMLGSPPHACSPIPGSSFRAALRHRNGVLEVGGRGLSPTAAG